MNYEGYASSVNFDIWNDKVVKDQEELRFKMDPFVKAIISSFGLPRAAYISSVEIEEKANEIPPNEAGT